MFLFLFTTVRLQCFVFRRRPQLELLSLAVCKNNCDQREFRLFDKPSISSSGYSPLASCADRALWWVIQRSRRTWREKNGWTKSTTCTFSELIWTVSSWITWSQVMYPLIYQRLQVTRSYLHAIVCPTEGFKEAAEKFRVESGIEPSVDLDSLDERIKIREMILKGQIQDAIALINSLHPELLDTNRYLYFHLQVRAP